MDLIIIGKYIVPFENTTWKMQWNTTERKRQKGTLEWQERMWIWKQRKRFFCAIYIRPFIFYFCMLVLFYLFSLPLQSYLVENYKERATKHVSKCISTHALRLQILLQNLNEIIWFLNTHKGILCEMYKSKYIYHYCSVFLIFPSTAKL